ncbi:alpha-amylase [Streptomyces sp. NPDC058326]|uniref:alpha-amylase n=1 Tax=Streptomyces sp. NPDC058326 TaxID=3346447 RepID=UPI0036E055A2
MNVSFFTRPAALTVASAAALLMGLTAAPSATAAEGSAPACVEYYSGWRYTTVVNSCDTAVSVTVEYTNSQPAPCRVLEPGATATFAGYGTDSNYVTGLRTCEPTVLTG